MILEAVVIVLREVLEAALLISLLLLACRQTQTRSSWLLPSAVLGLLGASLYASQVAWVSEQFDYSGQEIINSLLQLLIFACICLVFFCMRRQPPLRTLMMMSMGTAVALALSREASEIFLYLQGFIGVEGFSGPALAGATIGAVTGISAGVLVFYLLAWLELKQTNLMLQILLAVVVAGIVTQAVSLLEQVDRIPYSPAIWDTSAWIAEDSLLGQLLYALLGYEATPSIWHALTYVSSLLALVGAHYLATRAKGNR